MGFEALPIQFGFLQKQSIQQVIQCNEYTKEFGLTLTREQAIALVETHAQTLTNTGRIEFGEGVIDKIIKAFCDSPYISTHNYTSALHQFIQIFYTYKNETMDLASDEELLLFMVQAFNGNCQGSFDLLSGRELYRYANNLRAGRPYNYEEEDEENEVEPDEY